MQLYCYNRRAFIKIIIIKLEFEVRMYLFIFSHKITIQ